MNITQKQLEGINQLVRETWPQIPKSLLFSTVKELDFYLQELCITYINSFCIDNFEGYSIEESLENQMEWLHSNCKKKENILFLRNLLLKFCSGDYLDIIYLKDATSSGLQLISMVVRDPKLAKRTNLLAAETKEIHQEGYENMVGTIEKNKASVRTFFKDVLQLNLDNLKLTKKYRASIRYKIYKLITLPIHKVEYTKLNKDYLEDHPIEFLNQEQTKRIKEKIRNNMSKFQAKIRHSLVDKDIPLFLAASKELFKTLQLKQHEAVLTDIHNFKTSIIYGEDLQKLSLSLTTEVQKTLYKIRRRYHSMVLLDSMPEDFLNRKLVKNLGMPLSYGQGSDSRVEGLTNSFVEYYSEKGYSKTQLPKIDLFYLSIKLNDYFESVTEEVYQSVARFINITQDFVKEQCAVKVKSKYYDWSLLVKERNSSRHSFTFKYDGVIKTHKFTIYHPFSINTTSIKIKFPAIFIQSVEAHVVYAFLEEILPFNIKAQERGLPPIVISVNNDNFGINMLYAYLLVFITKRSYNTINELIFGIPDLDSSTKSPVIVEGDNLIKH